MRLACARCGLDVPPRTPEPVLHEDEDGDVLEVPVPAGWFPADDAPPAVVCVGCATDQEINRWVLAGA